ncbi:MAG: Fructose,6-bisphosphatase/inositol monophosphatase family enzyme, partial [Pseudonocardiales bacterium]|nr:Fructose,6-bisphosphatase/inositol monophosphatase family enzyme [Pseudonocardiales bacterium]
VADDLELAASLVRDAGRLAAAMLREGLTTEHKTSISDVVSAADHAAEELVVSRLREERPDDGVVGEEGTNRPGERTWYVDPVDGTYNFLSGLPLWCSAIALADADGVILGAVYQAATDELWLGGRDHPTTCNGVRLPTLADHPLAELSVATYLHPSTLPDDGARIPLLRAVQGAATVRMLGSGSIELAAIAAGRLGAWVQINSARWDWLPGVALVTAAGGATAVFEASGHRWHVAGSQQAVDEISVLVRGVSADSGAVRSQVAALATEAGARIGHPPRITFQGPVDDIAGTPIVASLAAVLTEALTNVARHAYASVVDVALTVSADDVVLIVADDGVGPNDEPTSGAGLRDMLRRADALGGTLTVEPNEPLGTIVRWSVPR